MSLWRDILIKDVQEIERMDYAKLNCIQQEIAELFQDRKLTKMEVFSILNGMLEKEMVNQKKAKKYYSKNYGAILEASGISLNER